MLIIGNGPLPQSRLVLMDVRRESKGWLHHIIKVDQIKISIKIFKCGPLYEDPNHSKDIATRGQVLAMIHYKQLGGTKRAPLCSKKMGGPI